VVAALDGVELETMDLTLLKRVLGRPRFGGAFFASNLRLPIDK